MKPFNTLSSLELINLTDDQIKEHLDYICAEEGLPLEVVEPVAPEAITNNEPDLFLMEIPAVVVSKDVGQTLIGIIDANTQYNKAYDSNFFDIVDANSYSSATAKVLNGCSKGKQAQVAADNFSLTKQWQEYNAKRDVFSEAVEKRQEKIEEIYNQISSARSQMYDQERMLAEWNKYLKLANNDRPIAEKFFTDRYSAEQLSEIMAIDEVATA